MKAFLFLAAAAVMMVAISGCSTGAAVNTPVVDVGAGVSAGQ